MTIYNVLSVLPVNNDTAVVVECPREMFKNGIGVLDEDGKPHEVISVGMDRIGNGNVENMTGKTSLLISGSFSSKKIYV